MQTLTPQEEGACVGTEMSGGQPLPSCRTSNLNPPCLTSRRSQPPLAVSVPLSRFTSRVGVAQLSTLDVIALASIPLATNNEAKNRSSPIATPSSSTWICSVAVLSWLLGLVFGGSITCINQTPKAIISGITRHIMSCAGVCIISRLLEAVADSQI